jgi:hypothetical protein
MSVKITLSLVFLSWLFVLSTASAASPEFGEILQQFDSIKLDEKVAVVGKVIDFRFHIYSPMYRDIESITIDVSKILQSENLSKQIKKIECKLPASSRMIAPFDTSVLDKTRNLKLNQEVLLLVGGKNIKNCEIIHLSKISGRIIQLPDWKEWKNEKISIEEAEEIIKRLGLKAGRLTN